MKDQHNLLKSKVEDAVRNLHGDCNVPLELTLSSLEEIKFLTEELIEAIECDMENQELFG